MSNEDSARYHARIKEIVSDSFKLPPESFDETTPFEELGLDSKERVRLLATLEIYFEVSIDLEERGRLTDVAGTAALLAELLSGKPETASDQ